MSAITVAIADALSVAEYRLFQTQSDEVTMEVSLEELPLIADAVVASLNGRLLSLFGSDERRRRGRFVVHHVWSVPALRTFEIGRAHV